MNRFSSELCCWEPDLDPDASRHLQVAGKSLVPPVKEVRTDQKCHCKYKMKDFRGAERNCYWAMVVLDILYPGVASLWH